MEDATQFLPLLALSIPFVIGNGYLAAKIGRNAAAWVIFTLIPLVNYFFLIYVAYPVIFSILDRVNVATIPTATRPAQTAVCRLYAVYPQERRLTAQTVPPIVGRARERV